MEKGVGEREVGFYAVECGDWEKEERNEPHVLIFN
jgi:hypothetical protein